MLSAGPKQFFIHNQKRTMSHHLDSPIARQDIRLDITDLYLFRGEVGTVFVIMSVTPSRAKSQRPAFTRTGGMSSR
jgi:hypothetical protein